MSYHVLYSREAERCLDEQLCWFEEDEDRGGSELADVWLERFVTALEKLHGNPTAQGLAPENGRWQPQIEVRQLRFRPWKSKPGWRVLFSVNEDAQSVTVLQIRHERRPLLGS